jgi:hypothetical protein
MAFPQPRHDFATKLSALIGRDHPAPRCCHRHTCRFALAHDPTLLRVDSEFVWRGDGLLTEIMAQQRLLELLHLTRIGDLRHHRLRHHKRARGQRTQEGQTLHIHEIDELDEHVCVRHDDVPRRRGWHVLRPREHVFPLLFTVIERHVLEHGCELRR